MAKKPTYEELEQKGTELEERLHGVDIRQLWDVYTQSPIPTLILSKEGKIESFNDAMAQLTGYAHKEVPDIAAWMPKIYPDKKYRNEVIEISSRSRHREVDVKRDEFIITTKNGESRHVQFSVFDILGDGGPTDLQIVQGEDVTERKQAEEELKKYRDHLEKLVEGRTAELKKANEQLDQKIQRRKQSEDELQEKIGQLHAILSHAPLVLSAVDLEGVFILSEGKGLEVLGRKPGQFVGVSAFDLYKENNPDIFGYIQRAMTGESVNATVKLAGEVFDVNYEPIRDDTGKISGVVGVSNIITERKQTEEALQERTHDLGERVKELGCLYGISGLVEKDISLDEILQRAADLIPSSWQYPEITCGRITLQGREFLTKNFKETAWEQAAKIAVQGQAIGSVEVYYLEEKPQSHEGPFLKEERSLINAVAGQLGSIIERKQAEAQIKASLKEKEVLLREIHHRVKNNMQVIMSLLRLQGDQTEDKKYADMLKESRDRIMSMSLIHESFYQSEDFANIDFGEYVRSLSTELFRSHGTDPNKIALKTEIEGVSLLLDYAIPCGLIINELVSNCLKHAFPQERKGQIMIALHSISEDEIELIVSDDGIGLPKDLDVRNTESLGLHLVTTITEHQLGGRIDVNREKGTEFHLQFKPKGYKARI